MVKLENDDGFSEEEGSCGTGICVFVLCASTLLTPTCHTSVHNGVTDGCNQTPTVSSTI